MRGVLTSSFADTIGGSVFNDTIVVQSGGQHAVDGRGGVNTVNYRGSDAIILDLGDIAAAPGGFGGWQGSITKVAGFDTLSNFHRGYGGAGNDTLLGTPDDDTLGGAQGNNLIDGRGGLNTVSYRSWQGVAPTHGAVIDLAAGTATNPWDGTDTLTNIQSADGSQFADGITGLAIAGSRTFIRGDGGNDTLVAGATDTLVTANYSSSLSGVFVHLGAQITFDDGWFGGSDTLVNIQSASGSAFDDALVGGTHAGRLDGNDGDDVIHGAAGDDTLNGGNGDDFLQGGGGVDRYAGGAGADQFDLLGEQDQGLYGANTGLRSKLAALDAVSDFNAAEGDTLRINEADRQFNLVFGTPKPLIWLGTLAAVAAPVIGLALPGQSFANVAFAAFWVPDAASGGWVVVDADRNGTLGADDFIVRLDAPAALAIGSGDFVSGTFITPILGDAGANSIAGTALSDLIGAGAGVDTVLGGAGDDTVDGGTGADRLYGGTGNDTFLVDTQADLSRLR